MGDVTSHMSHDEKPAGDTGDTGDHVHELNN